MRWIVLLAACVVPGFSLFGCSSDGVTPSCSEASLYHNRYTDEDRAAFAKDKTPRPTKNPAQPDLKPLVDDNCITGAGDPTVGSSGGSTNGGTGGTGGTAGTGGTGGTN